MRRLREKLRALAAHPWKLPVLLLWMGAALRLAWVMPMLVYSHADGEIPNVAIAYARSGVLADAFQPGQGPTAHVLPISPLYAGTVYRVFGVRTQAAELVLAVGATMMVLASFGLLYRCFGVIGTPRGARLAGLALLCLVPFNLELEAVYFRIWEGAFSTALAFSCLYALLMFERRTDIGWTRIAGMATGAALVFFVSPPLGLGIYLCALLVLVDRVPQRRWAGTVLIATAALALLIAPWALRNRDVMGEALLLRSNFGLELAIGNHPAALSGSDHRQVFLDRLQAIHPYKSKATLAAMQAAGGEIAYARALGAEAEAWIRSNPGGFIRLSARHLREFYFPPAWQWVVFADRAGGGRPEALITGIIAALGVAGALVAALLAWRRYRLVVIMLLVPALPYVIVQPVLRYRYVIFALLVFFGADLVARVMALRRGHRAAAVADRSAA